MITDKHTTHYINIHHKKIPVWSYGDPNNLPIFYIHGYFGGFSAYYGDLPIRYLMKDYYLIAFDLPGYGQAKDLELEHLEYISEIQRQVLKNKKIVLLGISYGGLLSIKYYLKYSQKVSKIIIGAMPEFSGVFSFYKLLAGFIKYKKRKISREFMNEFNILNKETLSKVKVPVLLYYSKRDYVANVWMGKKIHKMIPNSELFITKGQNHQWIMDRINKNGFLKVATSFLKS